MNIFFEFYKILEKLQKDNVEYALVGGLAVAFYSIPRFTKDIDFLIKKRQLVSVDKILKSEGYFASSKPWKFKNTDLILQRYMKILNKEEMLIDVLISESDLYNKIIDNAEVYKSEKIGDVKLAQKKDLIAMKRIRNSAQDKADIERLENEE
jgi:predicted nucleotidyltransferase